MSENVEPVEIPGVYFNHLSVGVQEAAGLATVHVVKEKGGFASATVRIADLLSALGYEDTTETQPREPRVGDRVNLVAHLSSWDGAEVTKVTGTEPPMYYVTHPANGTGLLAQREITGVLP